jgi:hypothetical protein
MEALSVEMESSSVGRSCGPMWAVLKDGKRHRSDPPLKEWAFCPGALGWQRHLAREITKVLNETGVEAIYLDSVALNYWLCEDTNHNHPYRRGYHPNVIELLKKVDEAVEKVAPDTVVYLEFWNSDVATQYMSGCFSPVVWAAMNYEAQGKMVEVTGTNLFRFYFPDFKIIELNVDKTGIELAFFNGNAIHGTFEHPEHIAAIKSLRPIWKEYIDCFTSDDVQALIETGVEDVYMNRFSASGKNVYTVWNASKEESKQAVLPVVVPKGWRAIDLLHDKGKELEAQGVPGKTTVTIDVPAHSLSVFVVKP